MSYAVRKDGQGWRAVNDKTDCMDDEIFSETQPLPQAPTQAELKQSKRREINSAFERAMQQIVGSYPANEVSSWAKQETEARAYQANNAAATPLLDALASSRSVNKAELVTRIIAKADSFAGISGTLIGRRQGLEDDLDALSKAATAEDIAAIAW